MAILDLGFHLENLLNKNWGGDKEYSYLNETEMMINPWEHLKDVLMVLQIPAACSLKQYMEKAHSFKTIMQEFLVLMLAT